MSHAFAAIDPQSYRSHPLHGSETDWGETNCYIDVWIELLHALNLDPIACMAMVFAIDFDGDQWTFFKPPHEDLYALYGIDVQELNVWRSILQNAEEQVRRGRVVLTETDSYYLPDTAGTDYRSNHVKTTIAIQEIDTDAQVLRYFHNGGYHQLQGEDFIHTFRVGYAYDPQFMPFFAEFVRLDKLVKHDGAALAGISRSLLAKHLARRPANNPFSVFKNCFAQDVEQLKHDGLAAYHAYAFASLRQLGAGFALGAHYLEWLEQHGQGQWQDATRHFANISAQTKTLLLKTARAVMAKKTVDFMPILNEMENDWEQGMNLLLRGLA
jgi:hypothetical protein